MTVERNRERRVEGGGWREEGGERRVEVRGYLKREGKNDIC
jgi:hypothetical protein